MYEDQDPLPAGLAAAETARQARLRVLIGLSGATLCATLCLLGAIVYAG